VAGEHATLIAERHNQYAKHSARQLEPVLESIRRLRTERVTFAIPSGNLSASERLSQFAARAFARAGSSAISTLPNIDEKHWHAAESGVDLTPQLRRLVLLQSGARAVLQRQMFSDFVLPLIVALLALVISTARGVWHLCH
jgi:hypothetical protein